MYLKVIKDTNRYILIAFFFQQLIISIFDIKVLYKKTILKKAAINAINQ